MKKRILLFLLALLPMMAWAIEAEVNGLWYDFIEKAKEAKVIQYKNNTLYSGAIEIPATLEYNGIEYSVTSIGDKAFERCKGLNSITIPNSLTSIGDYAFLS